MPLFWKKASCRDYSLSLGLLVLAAVTPYLNTFQVPWYFDDINNIVDNPLVRNLPQAARGLLNARGPAIFSFALNYHFGGLDLSGYHWLNLAIHAGCVVAVWLLLRQLFGTSSFWPLPGALIFAVHPLQTQAVTYVVQRMSSLAALLFLLATLFYLAYLCTVGRLRQGYYGLALLCGVLAVLTKENTAVLPIVLLLFERYFRHGRSWRSQILTLLPFCFAPCWLLWLRVGASGSAEFPTIAPYANQLITLQHNTPLHYLVTEFAVLWRYLRLLFVPVGQMFDYGWPVAQTLTFGSIAACLGLVALGGVAWRLRHLYPILSFGIAWFFVTLSVESSIIPLDPIFEHRLYLPLFGFVLVILDLLRNVLPVRWRMPLLGSIVLLLALLTWQRNALWNDPVAFWEDNLRRSPSNERVMAMLGNAYADAGRSEEGLQLLEQARKVNPGYERVYTAEAKILLDRQEGVRAIPLLLEGLRHHPQYVAIYEYLGVAYGQVGDFDESIRMLQKALRYSPQDASVLMNLGAAYSRLGNDARAIDYYQRSLEIDPDNEKNLFNYAIALFNLGDQARSLDLLRRIVQANPKNADAQYGRATMALAAGNRQEAATAAAALRLLGDERALELDAALNR